MPEDRHDVLRNLGRRVRELRLDRGLSQQQLAERCKLSTNYVSEVERGTRNPTVLTLDRLVRAGLTTGLADLFADLFVAHADPRRYPLPPPSTPELARDRAADERPVARLHRLAGLLAQASRKERSRVRAILAAVAHLAE